MKWLECPCEIENCVFRKMPEHEIHSRIMRQLLDTRVYMQIKSEHWLFVEIIAKYLEENEIEYSSSEALGKSIRVWVKRHDVHIFQIVKHYVNLRFLTQKIPRKRVSPVLFQHSDTRVKFLNNDIFYFSENNHNILLFFYLIQE